MNLLFPVHTGVLQLQPYVPEKPDEVLKQELGVSRLIKLGSNENCYGPSPLAIQAIQKALLDLHRYPDANGTNLRFQLSLKLGIPPLQILPGNGSTELVELICRTYLQPHNNTITADQTFIMYRYGTLAMNAKSIACPNKNYAFDLEQIRSKVDENTRIIFIANPNNPTGAILRKVEIERFLQSVPSHVLVVLDEAYREYVEDAEYPDGTRYLDAFPNVIVLRTFSKIYGLAGLRIGYAIASGQIIETLNRVRSPFNTNAIGQIAAAAALEDDAHIQASRTKNVEEREFLQKEFEKRRMEFVPSHANFIYLPMGNPQEIANRLLQNGIIVRPLPGGLRISIGIHSENEQLLLKF